MYPLLWTIFVFCQWCGESLAFDCGVMNCNWDNQFCNSEQQRCEGCDGHRHACFTHMMQANCTAFCRDYELKKQKEIGCKDPPNVTSGHYEETRLSYDYGSKVKVKCLPGYRLLGDPVLTCGDFGQWTHPPFCEDSPSDELVYGLIGALGWVLFFTALIYICFPKLRSKLKKSAPYNDNNTNANKDTDELKELLVTDTIPVTDANKDTEVLKEPLVTDNIPVTDANKDTEVLKEPLVSDNIPLTIKVGSRVFKAYANGESEESDKLKAEPVFPSQTQETETVSGRISTCQRPALPKDQLSDSDSDGSRVEHPQPGFSNSDYTNGCYMSSDRVQDRGDKSADAPRCRKSQASLRSKDSGFDSRATLLNANIGAMDGVFLAGQTINYTINVKEIGNKEGNKDSKEGDTNPVDEVYDDPVQENGESKRPDYSETEGVEETSKGKPYSVFS